MLLAVGKQWDQDVEKYVDCRIHFRVNTIVWQFGHFCFKECCVSLLTVKECLYSAAAVDSE